MRALCKKLRIKYNINSYNPIVTQDNFVRVDNLT